jgi:hypothetical protein
MDRQNHQVCVEQFVERMRAEFEAAMRKVGDAVNQAADGSWINGSEVAVLDILTEFRRKTFETALQMRVDASEGAFSPGGPSDLPPQAEQRAGAPLHAERQRARASASAALPQHNRGDGHARR